VDALDETALIRCPNAPNNYDLPALTGPIKPTFNTCAFCGLAHFP